MAKKNETKTEEEAEVLAAPEKEAKKKYNVLDGNGKVVRVVEDEEQAKELAKVYQGRVA